MTLSIVHNVALDAANTLAVSARAERYAPLRDPADLSALIEAAMDAGWTVRVLGEGSNVVLGERLDGLLIHQCCRGIELLEESENHAVVSAAAGENWHDFVQWCLRHDFYGLENLALIPGTVGAAPIQNIGAYGVEVGDCIELVYCRDLLNGEQLVLPQQECQFDYRESVFKERLRDRVIVESVTFRLRKTPEVHTSYPMLSRWLEQHERPDPGPKQVFDAVVAIRSSRLPDPDQIPNVGSFFKNPRVSQDTLERLLARYPQLPHYPDQRGLGYRLPAAWFIDQCGFKSRTEGPVTVHPEHSLVIVNPQRRPATEVRAFAAEIAASVHTEFGLQLEQEPRNYG